MEAVTACCAPAAVARAQEQAQRLAVVRTDMVAGLRSLGLDVTDGVAPFVLFAVPDPDRIRNRLADKGIAVRRCDTFVGLDGHHLRAAVRPEWQVLVEAIAGLLP